MAPAKANEARAAPPVVPRLTLEEKLWMDKRRSDVQSHAAIGGGASLGVAALVTTYTRTNRRMKLLFMLGSGVLGATAGFLYADKKALERIEDLSAQSRLRKDYQQMMLEKKAGQKQKQKQG